MIESKKKQPAGFQPMTYWSQVVLIEIVVFTIHMPAWLDKCHIICSHNPAPFYHTKIFLTLLKTFLLLLILSWFRPTLCVRILKFPASCLSLNRWSAVLMPASFHGRFCFDLHLNFQFRKSNPKLRWPLPMLPQVLLPKIHLLLPASTSTPSKAVPEEEDRKGPNLQWLR